MRKHIKVSLLCLSVGAVAHASADLPYSASHSFLTIGHIPFSMATPERMAGWRDRALARECGISGAFQIVPLGGRTTQRSDLGKYFMFCNKSELVVAEDLAAGSAAPNGAGNPNFRDVNAIHFNVQTVNQNFKSTIRFRPRQSYGGVGLNYRQYLHGRDACEKHWWFAISTPILHVRNDVNLTESVITPGTPVNDNVNPNMVEAFKGQRGFFRRAQGAVATSVVTGSVWDFGKINGSRARTRAGDIEVLLGYDYLCEECCHAEGWIGGVIPAGNKPEGHYVFEPIVGHNFHGGIMWGASYGWELWSSCDRYLHMEFATNGRYLFKNTQTRSLDVKGKPWSRYMLIYPSFNDAVSSAVQEGINVFTRRVKIQPRFNKDMLMSLVYTSCGFQAEAGYNVWLQASEKIRLDKPWDPVITFANVGQGFTGGGADGFQSGEINRAITIKENFAGSAIPTAANETLYNNNAIRGTDLDFESAATPCGLTFTMYGALGYRWDDWCYPVFVNAGASYELASEKGAPSRWMVWGKFGMSL